MVKACSDIKEEGCNGINLIMSYKPDLEVKNLSGDTPLSLAVKLNSLCSVEILVRQIPHLYHKFKYMKYYVLYIFMQEESHFKSV